MEPDTQPAGHVVVLNPQGRVDGPGGAPSPLRDRLYTAIEQGHGSVLLDVGQVSYMDSLLLGELVQAYASAIKRGATLKLLNVSKRLKDLLAVTRLDKVLETAEPNHRESGREA